MLPGILTNGSLTANKFSVSLEVKSTTKIADGKLESKLPTSLALKICIDKIHELIAQNKQLNLEEELLKKIIKALLINPQNYLTSYLWIRAALDHPDFNRLSCNAKAFLLQLGLGIGGLIADIDKFEQDYWSGEIPSEFFRKDAKDEKSVEAREMRDRGMMASETEVITRTPEHLEEQIREYLTKQEEQTKEQKQKDDSPKNIEKSKQEESPKGETKTPPTPIARSLSKTLELRTRNDSDEASVKDTPPSTPHRPLTIRTNSLSSTPEQGTRKISESEDYVHVTPPQTPQTPSKAKDAKEEIKQICYSILYNLILDCMKPVKKQKHKIALETYQRFIKKSIKAEELARFKMLFHEKITASVKLNQAEVIELRESLKENTFPVPIPEKDSQTKKDFLNELNKEFILIIFNNDLLTRCNNRFGESLQEQKKITNAEKIMMEAFPEKDSFEKCAFMFEIHRACHGAMARKDFVETLRCILIQQVTEFMEQEKLAQPSPQSKIKGNDKKIPLKMLGDSDSPKNGEQKRQGSLPKAREDLHLISLPLGSNATVPIALTSEEAFKMGASFYYQYSFR